MASPSTMTDPSGLPAHWTRTSVAAAAICFCLNLLDGMDILLMSYIAPALSQDWNVSAAALGVVFSAALFGMMLGALVLAPLADVYGRRPVIVGALTLMGVSMVLTGFARSIPELIAARFIVGLGIGAMLASMSAITAEYAPERYRNFAVTLLQSAYPLGAMVTGLVVYWALPIWGWRYMLFGGGIVTLLLLPLAIICMPESMEFLIRRQPEGALGKLNAIRNKFGQASLNSLPSIAGQVKTPVTAVFLGRWKPTLLLWSAFFSIYLTLYFVIAWTPKLAVQAGLAPGQAILAGTAYNFGAFVGGAFLAWVAVHFNLRHSILTMMIAGAISLLLFALPAPLAVVLFVAFLIGFFVQGGFAGLYPLAAQVYPAEVRSTGIGWAIGIGRAGAVVGPMLGGYMLATNTPLMTLFTVFAIPLLATGTFAWFIRARA